MHRILSAMVVSLVLSASAAQAAIVQTFSNSAAFLLAVPVPNSDRVTFGPVGPWPLIDLNGFAATASAGILNIAATTGDLFGAGTILSTEIDRDTLVLTFSQPLTALGLSGFITDALLNAVDGALLIDVVGSGQTSLAVTNAGAQFLGFRSDAAFSTLRISVSSFDQDATAVAFASLTQTIYIGQRGPPTAVPAPGFTALLTAAAAMVLARRRRIVIG